MHEKANAWKRISSGLTQMSTARCEQSVDCNDIIVQRRFYDACCRFGRRRNQGKSHFARRERSTCGVCVPKRDPREILREQRDSDAPIPRRSLPSVSRNEVCRVVPETSKASWRFLRFSANTRILRSFRKNVWVARDYVRTKRSSSTPRENETSRVTDELK